MAMYLKVAIILDCGRYFPQFCDAFETSDIEWDVDAAPYVQQASERSKGEPICSQPPIDVCSIVALVYPPLALRVHNICKLCRIHAAHCGILLRAIGTEW